MVGNNALWSDYSRFDRCAAGWTLSRVLVAGSISGFAGRRRGLCCTASEAMPQQSSTSTATTSELVFNDAIVCHYFSPWFDFPMYAILTADYNNVLFVLKQQQCVS